MGFKWRGYMTTDLPDKNNMNTFRSGFVAVVGRPNAGKSTLLNTLLGQKVVIISDKPQTTRNRIQCILTEQRGQIIFIDTPGIHKPKHRLGEYMVEAAKSALRGVDLALYVVDASVPIGTGDKYVLEILRESRVPCILALNKIDLLTEDELQQKIGILRIGRVQAHNSYFGLTSPEYLRFGGHDSGGVAGRAYVLPR